jgi:hypothetical protein
MCKEDYLPKKADGTFDMTNCNTPCPVAGCTRTYAMHPSKEGHGGVSGQKAQAFAAAQAM